MKALFSRFSRASPKEKDSTPVSTPKEKPVQLPPLPEWPPKPTVAAVVVAPTPPTIDAFKPLPAMKVDTEKISLSMHEQDASRSSNKTGESSGSDTKKTVAFISPPPTPTPDRVLPPTPPTAPAVVSPAPTPAPAKTTLTRFQAAHGGPQPKEPRGSTSAASGSTTDVSKATTTMKATSTRTLISPYPAGDSLRSGTPYSQMSNKSSRILAAASWSETAEDDLVSNLGSRERTRQEVLFEILASEERYVAELVKIARYIHRPSPPSPRLLS